MPSKVYRQGQSRKGNKSRRELEFKAVMYQVKKNKTRFINRLQNRIVSVNECLIYKGTKDHKGYARLNLRYLGQHITIHAHRLFLILKIGKPIPLAMEAGHLPRCSSRCCVKHVQLEHYKKNAATR